jgi:hypothetical protein
MPENPGPNQTMDDKLRDAAQKIETEVQRAIRYLNDEVVPQVRVQSSKGLREAAEQLRKLADQMDLHRRGGS